MPFLHFLDDSSTWEMLLGFLRVGQGRRTACRSIGLNYRALTEYLQVRPDREEDLLDAEAEFVEMIEEDLIEAAHKRHEPWAIAKLLARQGRFGEAATTTNVLVVTSAEEVGKLLGLIRQRELPEIVDVGQITPPVEVASVILSVEPSL